MLETLLTFPNPLRAAQAAWRTLRASMRGNPMADNQTVAARRQICAACPFFDPEWNQCNVCSCFVPLKTQLRTEWCPKGFWPRIGLTSWFKRTYFLS